MSVIAARVIKVSECSSSSTTEVSEQIRVLRAIVGHFIPLAVNRRLTAEDETRVRRAAVTAMAELPTDPAERVWRAACIGATLLDLLRLAQPEDAALTPQFCRSAGSTSMPPGRKPPETS